MNIGIDLTGKDNVKWAEVEDALEAMSRNQINEVSLSKADGWESIVASGENGLVTLAYFNNRSGKEAALKNINAKGITYKMKIGRQTVPIRDEIIVPIVVAKRVFEAFYNELDIFSLEGLEWL